MKKRIALLLLSTAVMLGMAACGGKKPEKETTQAVTADMTTEKAEATTEKVEESTEEAKTETESALKVISLKGPTSIGLVHLMEKGKRIICPIASRWRQVRMRFFPNLFPEKRILRRFLQTWRLFCIRNSIKIYMF